MAHMIYATYIYIYIYICICIYIFMRCIACIIYDIYIRMCIHNAWHLRIGDMYIDIYDVLCILYVVNVCDTRHM